MTHSQRSTHSSFAEKDGFPGQDRINVGAILLGSRLGAQLVAVLAAKKFQRRLLRSPRTEPTSLFILFHLALH